MYPLNLNNKIDKDFFIRFDIAFRYAIRVYKPPEALE